MPPTSQPPLYTEPQGWHRRRTTGWCDEHMPLPGALPVQWQRYGWISYFGDSFEQECFMAESAAGDTPHLTLGRHGHSMTLNRRMCAALARNLMFFATTGRLDAPETPELDFCI